MGFERRCFNCAPHLRPSIESNDELAGVVKKYPSLLGYNLSTGTLIARGRLGQDCVRDVMRCFTDANSRDERHASIRQLSTKSQTYLTDSDLESLQTFARRVRGEILFSRAWLLCEGQAEYCLLHAFANALGTPLDSHAVSVIDYQNNGNPGVFASLARALGFPWFLFCDNDQGGKEQIDQLRSRAFSDELINQRTRILPSGDLEGFISTAILDETLYGIAVTLDESFSTQVGAPNFGEDIAGLFRNHKTAWSLLLSAQFTSGELTSGSVPKFFAEIIELSIQHAQGKHNGGK